MDIGTKTRCYRQSKRHDLLTGQWEQKRYKQHRDRITNSEPRIDVKTPTSDSFQHVKVCSAHNEITQRYVLLCFLSHEIFIIRFHLEVV